MNKKEESNDRIGALKMIKTIEKNGFKINLRIEPVTTRLKYATDIWDQVIENVPHAKEYYHIYHLYFDVYNADIDVENLSNEDDAKVAVICGVFFDVDRCLKDRIFFTEALDIVNNEISDAFLALSKSEIFKENNSDVYLDILSSCYLERFWIVPEYRGNGIGPYFIGKLFDMFESYLQRSVPAIVTLPYPLGLRGYGMDPTIWEEMDKRLKYCLVKDGYIKQKDDKHYVKKNPN